MTRFGSGWAWLGVKADGTLAVTSTANKTISSTEGVIISAQVNDGTRTGALDPWTTEHVS